MPEIKKTRLFRLDARATSSEAYSSDILRTDFAVSVVYTTFTGTQAALEMAGRSARALDLRVVLWYLQVVPRQFLLARPPVSLDFMEQLLFPLAAQCCEGIETEIRLCSCTNLEETLGAALTPESVVVLGGTRRWWRFPEQRLAKRIESWGHRVLLVDTRRNRPTKCAASERDTA